MHFRITPTKGKLVLVPLLITVWIATGQSWADSMDHWHYRSPDATLEGGRAGCFDGPVKVIVGDHGLIAVSGGPDSWVQVDSGTFNSLLSIAFGGDRFVAVGEFGEILTSTNATVWTRQFNLSLNTLRSVAYGNGIFAAVGENSEIVVSADGAHWDEAMTGSIDFHSVCFGDGKFVAVGDHGVVLSSVDGISWTRRSAPTVADLSIVQFGGGQFLAGGSVKTVNGSNPGGFVVSKNGIDWIPGLETGGEILALIYAQSGWVWVTKYLDWQNGGQRQPTISLSWSASSDGYHYIQPISGPYYDPALRFLAYVEGEGWYSFVGPATLYRMKAENQWEPANAYYSLISVVSTGSRILGLAGDGGLVTSTNGSKWETTPLPLPENRCCYNSLAYGNGTLIALGYGLIATSSGDGNWTWRTPPLTNQLSAGAYGNGLWVIVGKTIILTSSDSVNWQGQTFDQNAPDFFGVTFGNGRFVVTGYESQPQCCDRGLILVSTDGTHWDQYSLTNSISRPLFGNGYFLARSPSHFLKSTDGSDWDYYPHQGIPDTPLAFGDGIFVSSYASSIYTSTDGIEWIDRIRFPLSSSENSQVTFAPYIGTYGFGTFVLMGSGSRIVQSDPVALGLPEILESPRDAEASAGSAAVLTVRATGTSPIRVQWYKDGKSLPGETNAILVAMPTQSSSEGDYRAMVTNPMGSVLSDPARVTVLPVGTPKLVMNSPARLTISGAIGRIYSIQYASTIGNGFGWIKAATVKLNARQEIWMDPDGETAASRFYQAVLVP